MKGLLGQIPEHEIVKIAREAAEKRRIEGEEIAKKKDKQMRLDGTVEPVPVCRGYAIYADFNEYMGQKMAKGRLKPVRGGWFHHTIKEVLEVAGWKRDTAHRPTRFYPPEKGEPVIIR